MKTIIKYIVSFICILFLFTMSYEALKYILIDDTNSYTRITMHQLYGPENIDVLFLGSSHCYRSLNPAVTDIYFNSNTFNGGSSAQEMDGSLTIAKEAIKNHNIKHIYLEMLYSVAMAKPRNEREQLTSTYIISDYMHPGLNRLYYLINASSSRYFINSFFIPLRNRSKLTDLNYIKEVVKKKQSYEYRNYIWNRMNDPYEYYVNKGFVANDGSLEKKEIWTSPYYPKEFDPISEEWKKDVKEISELCQKHNIELTFFVAPLPEWSLLALENYDNYKSIVAELANECNVDYYDFNYIDPCYFDSSNPEYYKDNGHLNTIGANAFSNLFGKFMTGKIPKEGVLYKTLEDKLEHEEPHFLGLAKSSSENETDKYESQKIKIISNKSDMEYKICLISKAGKLSVLQDFDINRYFSVPSGFQGKIKIEWKTAEPFSVTDTVYYNYPDSNS